MSAGHLALVLHAHLPFVRHPEHEEFLEENWLFEAITETYIPLITMLERLRADGVPFELTMSLTPPLCAMLGDELLQARYVRYLGRTIELAEREIARTREQPPVQKLAHFYRDLLVETRRRYRDEWQCNLLAVFRRLRDAGGLEIIASAATHAILPLLANSPEALRAQVLIGCDVYRETFGAQPTGFWLPECAYSPALDHVLQEANLRWFILDSHGLSLAEPRPRNSIYRPCFTAAGPAAFARDPESSRQVWSAETGYPGNAVYRDFYRDIGYDLPPDEAFWNSADRTPRFTGLKYHRVTGGEGKKEIYDRAAAVQMAEIHAQDFLEARRRQLSELRDLVHDPLIVMPFDAELFGHWWYEGPKFLECLLRNAARFPHELKLTTPGEYLAGYSTQQVVRPASSSWGEGGYFGVWLNESNSWIYPHLAAAVTRMIESARSHGDSPAPLVERVLKQLARELLLAQASDWAFLIKTGTARQYAAKRTTDHITRFNRLHEQLQTDRVDEAFLSECEARDNLFEHVDWRYYR